MSRATSFCFLFNAALASASIPLAAASRSSNGFLSSAKQRVALLHLRALGEQHLVHERLDARAHLDVLRRIELSDELVDRATFVAATSMTCTTGGGNAGGAAFLQPDAVNATTAAISHPSERTLVIGGRRRSSCASSMTVFIAAAN